jgi:ParB-like chromosome segregation protein Spo0J
MPKTAVDQATRSDTVRVAIAALRPADSPRLGGEDLDHIRVLAESGDALPPILVHRPTMCVIDGMHRLRAARLRGESDIDVTYYDGDATEAFIEAVRANTTHGLPLTLADRRAAALRILMARPEMSDRSVARLTGLSPKTVGAARPSAGAPLLHQPERCGPQG